MLMRLLCLLLLTMDEVDTIAILNHILGEAQPKERNFVVLGPAVRHAVSYILYIYYCVQETFFDNLVSPPISVT